MQFSIFNFQFSKKLIYLPVLLAAAFTTPRQPAFAADLQTANTQIEQRHEELLQVNDDTTLSPEVKIQKEVDARVNIVHDALSLSLKEISNLKDSLNKLPKFEVDSREDVLREGFISDLKEFEDYYIAKQDEVSKTGFTLDAIKDFAKTIIDYRDTVYNPKTTDIVNFTLLFYNEDAIATAKIRLTKIISNIKTLEKLNIIKAGYFQMSINESSDLLKESDALNLKARNIIILGNAQANSSIAGVSPQDIIDPPNVGELLIKSLGNIKSAYEIFVQIGKDTKKILGIR